jgi:hypothetical protein
LHAFVYTALQGRGLLKHSHLIEQRLTNKTVTNFITDSEAVEHYVNRAQATGDWHFIERLTQYGVPLQEHLSDAFKEPKISAACTQLTNIFQTSPVNKAALLSCLGETVSLCQRIKKKLPMSELGQPCFLEKLSTLEIADPIQKSIYFQLLLQITEDREIAKFARSLMHGFIMHKLLPDDDGTKAKLNKAFDVLILILSTKEELLPDLRPILHDYAMETEDATMRGLLANIPATPKKPAAEPLSQMYRPAPPVTEAPVLGREGEGERFFYG